MADAVAPLSDRARVGVVAVAVLAVVLTAVVLTFGGSSFVTQVVANGLGVAVGLVIVVRGNRPEARRMGWLVALAMVAIDVATLAVLTDWLFERGHEDAAAWAAVFLGSASADSSTGVVIGILLVPFGLVAVCFPDGRLRPGWRWFLWASGAVVVVVSVAAALSPPRIGDTEVAHPFLDSIASETWVSIALLGVLGLAVLGLASVGCLVARYRDPRATPDTRQQIKWFGFGVGLYFFTAATLLTLEAAGVVGGDVTVVVDGIAFTAIPISLGVAILRHRLYDIDRIISRTLAYALTFALLTGVFVLIAASPVLVTGSNAETFPPLLVSISTLVVAALFNPLRRRLVRSLERRFDRAHYDAEVVIEDFGDRVNDLTDRAAIEAGVADVLARTLAPTTVGIWIAERDS